MVESRYYLKMKRAKNFPHNEYMVFNSVATSTQMMGLEIRETNILNLCLETYNFFRPKNYGLYHCVPVKVTVSEEIENEFYPGFKEQMKKKFTRILLLGDVSLNFFNRYMKEINEKPLPGSIKNLRGCVHNRAGMEVVVSYSLSQVFKSPKLVRLFGFDGRLFAQGGLTSPEPNGKVWGVKEFLSRDYEPGTECVLDIETTGLDFWKDKIRLIGLLIEDEYFIINFEDLSHRDWENVVVRLSEDFSLIGHNSKFDANFLRFNSKGVVFPFKGDTLLMAYALYPDGDVGLEDLSRDFLGFRPNWKEETLKGKKSGDLYRSVDIKTLGEYLCYDLLATRELHKIFSRQIDVEKMHSVYHHLIELNAMVADIEYEGVRIDKEYFKVWGEKLEGYAEEIKGRLGRIFYAGFNPNSPVQVKDALKGLGLNVPDTGEETLLRYYDHEPIKLIIMYRKLRKLVSGYINRFMRDVDSRGYIHPVYKIHGTETGRFSSAIHTLPNPGKRAGHDYEKRLEELIGVHPATIIRGGFLPDEGESWISADYGQIEVRVAAWLGNVEYMLEILRDNPKADIHSENALRIFGEGFTKTQRSFCKIFMFGVVLYGGSVQGAIPDSLGMDKEKVLKAALELKALWQGHFNRTKTDWEEVQENGYVTIKPFGRRRYFRNVNKQNKAEILRAVMNTPIQSFGSGDLNNLAALELWKMGFKVKVLVHDEINLSAKIDEGTEAFIREVMIGTGGKYMKDVPLDVDVEISERWGND